MRQASYIDEATKQEWMTLTTPKLAARYGWIDQYETLQTDSGSSRAPQRLLARAITGYAEGVLGAQAIATLRGITVESAKQELVDAGVTMGELQDEVFRKARQDNRSRQPQRSGDS